MDGNFPTFRLLAGIVHEQFFTPVLFVDPNIRFPLITVEDLKFTPDGFIKRNVPVSKCE